MASRIPSLVAYAGSSSESDEEDSEVHVDGAQASSITDNDDGGGKGVIPELEASWQQCLDKSSGQVYFWNKATGETTWKNPINQEIHSATELDDDNDGPRKDEPPMEPGNSHIDPGFCVLDIPSPTSKRRRVQVVAEDSKVKLSTQSLMSNKNQKDGEENSKDVENASSFTASVLTKGAEVLSKKLKYLKHDSSMLSPDTKLHCSIMIRLEDFKAGELSTSYFADKMKEVEASIKRLEKDAAPEGWKLLWDSNNSAYFFASTGTGETCWTLPEASVAKSHPKTMETKPALSIVHPGRVRNIDAKSSRENGSSGLTQKIKPAGLVNKKVTSLVEKWNKVSEEEINLKDEDHRSAEQWKSWKKDSNNPNLESVVGDWKLKRLRLIEKKAQKDSVT